MTTPSTSAEKTKEGDENGHLIEDGKNRTKVNCQRCQCVVLAPKTADFCNLELYLPHMKKKSAETSGEGETLQQFWKVKDMFEFENVGFCNTVNDIKYLACADCEVGPIGLHNINDKTAFYVALDRVEHK